MCFKNECGNCIIQYCNVDFVVRDTCHTQVMCESSTEWLWVTSSPLIYVVPVMAIVGIYVVLYQPLHQNISFIISMVVTMLLLSIALTIHQRYI